MEVSLVTQRFTPMNGRLKFNHSRVLFHDAEGAAFIAKSPERLSRASVDMAKLEDIQKVPSESYCPPVPSNSTITTHSSGCYLKKPNLMSFDGGEDIANLVVQELAICEIIQKRPHSNIATYKGCQVSAGRVVSLCFTYYPETLLERVNPGHLNKAMLLASKSRADARRTAAHYLSGIEKGIEHLHSLNIVHNDINPANIMIGENGTPVITDFDSSSAPGTALDRTKRTYGWYDPDVRVSQPSNDLNALAELRVWLTGASPSEY